MKQSFLFGDEMEYKAISFSNIRNVLIPDKTFYVE